MDRGEKSVIVRMSPSQYPGCQSCFLPALGEPASPTGSDELTGNLVPPHGIRVVNHEPHPSVLRTPHSRFTSTSVEVGMVKDARAFLGSSQKVVGDGAGVRAGLVTWGGPSGWQDEGVYATSENPRVLVRNATPPCLDTFCRLDRLGLSVTAQRVEPDHTVLRLLSHDTAASVSGLRQAGGPTRCGVAPVGARAARMETDDPGGGGSSLPVLAVSTDLASQHHGGSAVEGEAVA